MNKNHYNIEIVANSKTGVYELSAIFTSLRELTEFVNNAFDSQPSDSSHVSPEIPYSIPTQQSKSIDTSSLLKPKQNFFPEVDIPSKTSTKKSHRSNQKPKLSFSSLNPNDNMLAQEISSKDIYIKQ